MMKYILKSLFLFILLSSSFTYLNAQYLVTDTVFHFSVKDAASDMVVADDGGCILIGKFDSDSITPKNIWMKRLGFIEDSIIIKWEKSYIPQNTSRVGSMIQSSDNNLIVTGAWNNNNMIHKLSMNGDSLETQLFPGNVNRFFKEAIEMPNNDLIVLEHDASEYWYAKLLRINSTGTVIWEIEYIDFRIQSLQYYNADTFYVAGSEYHLNYEHLVFMSFASNGTEIFNNFYQNYYGSNNCGVNDSIYFYLGNKKEYTSGTGLISQVVKMNMQGEVEWDLDYTGIGSELIKDLHVYDNYLIAGSDVKNMEAEGIVIAGITFDGILASSFIHPKANPGLASIGVFNQFLYVFGMETGDTTGRDVFLMVFDLDSTFIISEVQELAIESNVRIYPNPVNDFVTVDFGHDNPSEKVVFTIYNSLGRIEKQFTSKGTNSEKLNLGDLETGLYFLTIYVSGKSPVSRKIIKY